MIYKHLNYPIFQSSGKEKAKKKEEKSEKKPATRPTDMLLDLDCKY